jgi:general secretion pathway protein A
VYHNHFGLKETPFDLTPNPAYLFMSASHREALANLQYGLAMAKPITLLVGEAGTGKTTLLRTALASDMCRALRTVTLSNSVLTREEFVETLAREFHLSERASRSKAALLAELETTLNERRARGEMSALIVDEGQRLSDDLLEEIRLLANIETDTVKLLPLVLAGQPELSDRLDERQLRQLKQRVALRCDVMPFSVRETADYIASRIRTAGGIASRLFTREAVILIHESSEGIPRTINVLCDNALLAAFAAGRTIVNRDLVDEVARDFKLGVATTSSAPTAPPPDDLDRSRSTELNAEDRQAPAAATEDAQAAVEPHADPPVARRFQLFGS